MGSQNGVDRNYAFIAFQTPLFLIFVPFVSFVVNPTAGFGLKQTRPTFVGSGRIRLHAQCQDNVNDPSGPRKWHRECFYWCVLWLV